MKSSEFLSNFTTSDLAKIIDRPRAEKLKRRLQEAGKLAKYADPVLPGEAAFFLLSDPNSANALIQIFHESLTRTEQMNPATGQMEPVKTSLRALTDIIQDRTKISALKRLYIDQHTGDMIVKLKDRSEQFFPGIHSGDPNFPNSAASVAIFGPAALEELHTWTNIRLN